VTAPTIFVDFDFVGQFAVAALAYNSCPTDKSVGARIVARNIGRRIDLIADCQKLWEANKPNEWTADSARRAAKAIAGEGFVAKACRVPPSEAEVFEGLS